MKYFFFFIFVLVLSSCSTTKNVSPASTADGTKKSVNDDTYGYAENNPVKVGGVSPANERAYLNRLTGPNGEKVSYVRKGSCCPFKTPKGIIDNMGMLDIYEVTYDGLEKPVNIYVNMYDKDELFAPKGFLLIN